MNIAILVGKLHRVRIVTFKTGGSMAMATIVHRSTFFSTKQNKEVTNFKYINCKYVGKGAEELEKFVGRLIMIHGENDTNSYENKEGKKIYEQYITFNKYTIPDRIDAAINHDRSQDDGQSYADAGQPAENREQEQPQDESQNYGDLPF